MKRKTTAAEPASSVCYETIEADARDCIQRWLQELLEAEVTEVLGRAKSHPSAELEEPREGYHSGYGKPRKVALSSGTVTVRRLRIRNLERRLDSRVLPLFKRSSHELGAMLPELCLHGLASGDLELALRGLLGEGAPFSAGSPMQLNAAWRAEYAAWKRADLSQFELVYCWADGLYVKARLGDRKAALD